MGSLAGVRPASVDFHLDLMCPYAYQTSLWIREVRDRTGWRSTGGSSAWSTGDEVFAAAAAPGAAGSAGSAS